MGRQCKRVPLDFDWPIKKTWVGYLNPYHGVECPYCENGWSPEATKIRHQVYPRLDGINNLQQNPFLQRESYYQPDAKEHHMAQDEVDYVMENTHEREMEVIRKWVKQHYPDADKITPEIFSHLCLDNPLPFFPGNLDYTLIKYHSKKEGWDSSCPHCNGEGYLYATEDIKRLHDEWTDIDPPTGEGYQMWEDTSEGSPLTPVFATAEELAEYCERTRVSWFGNHMASKEEWLELINEDRPATVEIAPGVVVM